MLLKLGKFLSSKTVGYASYGIVRRLPASYHTIPSPQLCTSLLGKPRMFSTSEGSPEGSPIDTIYRSLLSNNFGDGINKYDGAQKQDLFDKFLHVVSHDLAIVYVLYPSDTSYKKKTTRFYVHYLKNLLKKLSLDDTNEMTIDEITDKMYTGITRVVDDETENNPNYQQTVDKMSTYCGRIRQDPDYLEHMHIDDQFLSICLYAYRCDVRNLKHIKDDTLRNIVDAIYVIGWDTW